MSDVNKDGFGKEKVFAKIRFLFELLTLVLHLFVLGGTICKRKSLPLLREYDTNAIILKL